MVEILAMINIAIGLLMLLGCTALYSFTKDANIAVDQVGVSILKSYQNGEIDESYYTLILKQRMFLKISIHFGWIVGLVYCGVVIVLNVILLVAVRLNHLCLLQFWLVSTMTFDVIVLLFLSEIFIFGILLFDITYATLFFIVSTLIFVMPSITSWSSVLKVYKKNQQDQNVQNHYNVA